MIGHKTTFFAPLGDCVRLELKVWPATEMDGMHDTWEAAAHKAVNALTSRFVAGGGEVPVASAAGTVKSLRKLLDGMTSPANSDTFNEGDLLEGMIMMGARAIDHVSHTIPEIVRILAAKQAAYGQGNINAFGLTGLHVRMSDKVNRLENLLEKQRVDDGITESIDDTWLDIVGYATIAIMLVNGTFEYPLTQDLPSPVAQLDELLAEIKEQILESLDS